MATSTTAAKTFTCELTLRPTSLAVRSPKGGLVEIDTTRFDADLSITPDENALVLSLLNSSEFTVDLTVVEMRRLLRVASVCGMLPKAPSVPAKPVEAPKPTPSQNPVPTQPASPLGAVKAVLDNTTNAVVNGVIDHHRPKHSIGPKDEVHAAEREITRLERAAKTLTGRLSMVIYDIPTYITVDGQRKLNPEPSPCWLFWRHGFYANKSCAFVTEAGLASEEIQQLLANYRQKGYEVHIVPQDPTETERCKAICVQKLDTLLRELHTSLITRISNADNRLTAAINAHNDAADNTLPLDETPLQRARDNAVRQAIRDTAAKLDTAIVCATTFDDTGRTRDLIVALRAALVAEQRAYNADAEVRKACLSDASIPSV